MGHQGVLTEDDFLGRVELNISDTKSQSRDFELDLLDKSEDKVGGLTFTVICEDKGMRRTTANMMPRVKTWFAGVKSGAGARGWRFEGCVSDSLTVLYSSLRVSLLAMCSY